jgi:hypothetical protein
VQPRIGAALQRIERTLFAWVGARRLGAHLALLAVLLAAPSLLIGLQLDDHVARFIYSDGEDAARLFDLYEGGYGFANGNPADNHWQIEEGHAPWWMPATLRLAFFRPLSVATHWLDFALWPDSPWLMHAHSLLWLALLVVLTTRLYRSVSGAFVGGLAGLLFALDHTHGFAVGFISNRHAMISAVLGVACLLAHRRGCARGSWSALAPASYLLALLASEASIAVAGYLFAHALFVEDGPAARRARRFAPYLLVTVLWRGAYSACGYGGYGSGLYIDPASEPWHFTRVLMQRAPFQLLGQLLVPPSELYWLYDSTQRSIMWAAAATFCAAFGLALVPLLRRERVARFWALGGLIALVPASAGYPSGRQMMLASLGALALVALLWNFHAVERRAALQTTPLLRVSAMISALVLGVHLFVAPLASPLASCGVALSSPLARAADDLGPEIADKDLVLVTSPDYFSLRLAQLRKRNEGSALARRWRGLGFGPEPVQVFRPDASTLELRFVGGILTHESLELFRDRRLRMQVGEQVQLEGLRITVLAITHDGRAERVRFAFDTALEAPNLLFYYWRDDGYVPFVLPKVGQRVQLPPAILRLSL